MKDAIAESLSKIREIEFKSLLTEADVGSATARSVRDAGAFGQLATMGAAKVAPKALGKLGAKLVPGLGVAVGAADAYNRAKMGDTTGAAISGLTGAASTIPVVGTAASMAGMGIQAIRDKMRTGSWMPDDTEIASAVAKDSAVQPTATAAAPTPPGADPKVLALQKQLIAKGAKITADGKMGQATQAAMKQFPGVAVAEQNKGNNMSEAQKIAELRDRLAQLESTPQNTDEGVWDAVKAGAQGVGNFFKGAKAGVQGGTAASNVASGAANLGKAGDKGLAAAQAVKGAGSAVKAAATGNTAKNIAKVGGGAAVGAAGMAALGGAGATKPADPTAPTAPAKPGAPTAPAAGQTPNAGADPADVTALNAMAAELENSQDPADIELLKRYNGIINAINNAAPGEKRTVAQVAANADAGSEPEPQ
jgi:hypothetical protein